MVFTFKTDLLVQNVFMFALHYNTYHTFQYYILVRPTGRLYNSHISKSSKTVR